MILLDDILTEAVRKKASDVHFSVGEPPIYRIDGELIVQKLDKLSPPDVEKLILPIVDERHKEELEKEGETDFAYSISGVGRFRVNVFKQRGTLACVMRILPFGIPEAETLGLTKEIINITSKKRGLFLVTGITGSGKSTTLASLIHVINQKYKQHIITLEDPIEYLHRHGRSIVNQREIGSDAQSYSHALRAALRQDPDVILVGEMRDLETISTAITAAETGHLVLSTLHTVGAANTVDRIIDVFPERQQQQIRIQLSTVLEGVVSQQLIPRASGKGRVAALEIMFATSAIRNQIREGKTYQIPSTIQTSRKLGMQTMDDAIYDLYMNNLILAEDAVAFSQDQAAMSKRVMLDF
ncbi:MAG: type IV pilus twitching motility protein PilT [Lachnospiraceae bacterium]|nr:type IV pilus twitching motility protein PilT [Lachnospiraceae bacterium]